MEKIDFLQTLATIGVFGLMIWMAWRFASAQGFDENERPITGEDFVGENMEHERDA